MRQLTIPLIGILGFLTALSSCKDTGTTASRVEISGTYIYKAFDLNGVQVGSGTLILSRSDSQLSGKLRLVGSARADSIEGRIIEQDSIEFYSNPHEVVLNFLLWRGTRNDGTIGGDVYSLRFDPPVPLKTGTFRADRIGD